MAAEKALRVGCGSASGAQEGVKCRKSVVRIAARRSAPEENAKVEDADNRDIKRASEVTLYPR